MYAKIHKFGNQIVLACCDRELIGKEIKDKKFDIKVNESFYKGEIIDDKKLAELLDVANNINLLGNKAVGVALKKGLVSDKDIIKIKNIAHVQIFKL